MKLKIRKSASLLEVLAAIFPDSSKTTLRSWIKQGRVTLQNRPLYHTHMLISKNMSLNFEDKVKQAAFSIKILYEDKDIVVLQKPEGLLSVATNCERNETAHAALKRRQISRQVLPVHRLDRETSGVMVFAYTQHARQELKRQFHCHTIDRKYLALIEGCILLKQGTWKSRLKEDMNYFVFSHPEGKQAITHYKLIYQTTDYSALLLTLETGRKNQIRVQASEAGFPIVGDPKYGATCNPLQRLGLHAYFLSFIHPVTKNKMAFQSPIPPSFTKYFKRLI